eukprot:s3038_g3.t1
MNLHTWFSPANNRRLNTHEYTKPPAMTCIPLCGTLPRRRASKTSSMYLRTLTGLACCPVSCHLGLASQHHRRLLRLFRQPDKDIRKNEPAKEAGGSHKKSGPGGLEPPSSASQREWPKKATPHPLGNRSCCSPLASMPTCVPPLSRCLTAAAVTAPFAEAGLGGEMLRHLPPANPMQKADSGSPGFANASSKSEVAAAIGGLCTAIDTASKTARSQPEQGSQTSQRSTTVTDSFAGAIYGLENLNLSASEKAKLMKAMAAEGVTHGVHRKKGQKKCFALGALSECEKSAFLLPRFHSLAAMTNYSKWDKFAADLASDTEEEEERQLEDYTSKTACFIHVPPGDFTRKEQLCQMLEEDPDFEAPSSTAAGIVSDGEQPEPGVLRALEKYKWSSVTSSFIPGYNPGGGSDDLWRLFFDDNFLTSQKEPNRAARALLGIEARPIFDTVVGAHEGGLHHDTLQSSKSLRIAVYTENIGSYDPVRSENIAAVPEGVKAFYFLDELTIRKNERALEKWKEKGWTIQPYTMVEGTKYINAPRLTCKRLKFQPPSFLTKNFDWLIHHDANIRMDLERIAPFLRARQNSAMVLLDYCYEYPQCCGEGRGLECFKHSTGFYLSQAPQLTPEKISTSMDKLKSWRDLVIQKVQKKQMSMPHFYKLNVIIRNLQHEKAAQVKDAFDKVYEKSHEMQRDQPILPVYLEDHNLTQDISVVSRYKSLGSFVVSCVNRSTGIERPISRKEVADLIMRRQQGGDAERISREHEDQRARMEAFSKLGGQTVELDG